MKTESDDPAEALTRGTIRKVLRSETHLIKEHLLRLGDDARRRRFGHDVSDRFVTEYARHAADLGNFTIAYFCEGEIRAVAELRQGDIPLGNTGEIALSVESAFANRGIGTGLMARIITSARNRGLKHLIMVCLADNVKMQAIARHYGADLKIEEGSVIAEILPAKADCTSMAAEYFDNRFVFMQAALDLHSRISRWPQLQIGNENRPIEFRKSA